MIRGGIRENSEPENLANAEPEFSRIPLHFPATSIREPYPGSSFEGET